MSEHEPLKEQRNHLHSPVTFVFFLCLLSFSEGMNTKQLHIWISMKCHKDSCPGDPSLSMSHSVGGLSPFFAGNFKRSLRTTGSDISYANVPGNVLLEIAPRLNGNMHSSGTRLDEAGAVSRRWDHTPTWESRVPGPVGPQHHPARGTSKITAR